MGNIFSSNGRFFHLLPPKNRPTPTSEPIPVTSLPVAFELSEVYADKARSILIANDDIFSALLPFLSPATLISMSRTCRGMKALIDNYIAKAFRITPLLSRYFTNIDGFRLLQFQTDTLIGGSTALQFFSRTIYSNPDLDIYVPRAHRDAVGQFVLNDGYVFQPGPYQPATFAEAVHAHMFHATYNDISDRPQGILAVWTFEKQVDQSIRKIQVIVAEKHPLEVILNYHSTCVMNVISWKRAYCLFPKATLESRVSAITRHTGAALDFAIRKYTQRGYKLYQHVPTDLQRLFPRNCCMLLRCPRVFKIDLEDPPSEIVGDSIDVCDIAVYFGITPWDKGQLNVVGRSVQPFLPGGVALLDPFMAVTCNERIYIDALLARRHAQGPLPTWRETWLAEQDRFFSPSD